MNEDQQPNTIEDRIAKQKEELIELFRKSPIVQMACEKLGVGRTTYYRWRKEDAIFAGKADDALNIGRHLINDLAESKLIKKIQQDEDFNSIKYWLSHNHKRYETKLTITPSVVESNELPRELVAEIDRLFEINGQANTQPSTTTKPEEPQAQPT